MLFRGRRDLTRVRLLLALRATASWMQTSNSVLQRATVVVVAAVAATATAAAVRAPVVASQAQMEIKGIKRYRTAGCE